MNDYTGEVVACYVHTNKILPKKVMHIHHRTPRAAGGELTPENEVFLCPDCHVALHQMAGMMLHGKTGAMIDVLNQAYQIPAERGRIMELTTTAAEALSVDSPNSPHIVVVIFEPELFGLVKRRANDFRDKKRSVGVARYLRALAIGDLKKQGVRLPANIVP